MTDEKSLSSRGSFILPSVCGGGTDSPSSVPAARFGGRPGMAPSGADSTGGRVDDSNGDGICDGVGDAAGRGGNAGFAVVKEIAVVVEDLQPVVTAGRTPTAAAQPGTQTA